MQKAAYQWFLRIASGHHHPFVGIRYGNMFRIMESYHMDLEDITLSHQVAQVLIE